MDYALLEQEILNDPEQLGYFAHLIAGNDVAIAELLNTRNQSEVTAPVLTRNQFLVAVLPATIAIASLDAQLQAKWDRILSVATAADAIDITNNRVQGLLAIAVSDGVLTQDQVNAIGKRQGSRAEVLFGTETTISTHDIAKALRGDA